MKAPKASEDKIIDVRNIAINDLKREWPNVDRTDIASAVDEAISVIVAKIRDNSIIISSPRRCVFVYAYRILRRERRRISQFKEVSVDDPAISQQVVAKASRQQSLTTSPRILSVEDKEVMLQVLLRLPKPDAMLYVERVYMELTYDELAGKYQIDSQTIRKRFQRIQAKVTAIVETL